MNSSSAHWLSQELSNHLLLCRTHKYKHMDGFKCRQKRKQITAYGRKSVQCRVPSVVALRIRNIRYKLKLHRRDLSCLTAEQPGDMSMELEPASLPSQFSSHIEALTFSSLCTVRATGSSALWGGTGSLHCVWVLEWLLRDQEAKLGGHLL